MKKNTRMVAEGSVLVASASRAERPPTLLPMAFAHPVYRAGFALALPVPLKVPA